MVCETCGAIQPPRALDHFARFGLQPALDLDIGDLEARYFDMQRRFHPDRFATRSARERALSLQHASNFNEAYEILKEPLSRAEYLLELRGADNQSACETTIDNQEILIEALERREALDSAETLQEVDRILSATESDMAACLKALTDAFGGEEMDAAGRLTMRLKYLDKLQAEARSRRARIVAAS